MARFEMLFYGMQVIQARQRCSAEMHPVNAPGIVRSACISMLHILGKDKKLVGAYLVSFAVDLVPAISVHAIKQEVLMQPVLPLRKMSLCFRIKPQAGNV